jgi:ubiquinol-cytochrome c reductase cytochrome b subunit
MALLHEHGSNNPLGIHTLVEKIPLFPYFVIKDAYGFFLLVLIFTFFVVNIPNALGHPDNYIEAQPLVTPTHIVPE